MSPPDSPPDSSADAPGDTPTDAVPPEVRAAAAAEELAARVRELPAESGVYLFRGDEGAVLYVGKAQNLRQRVRSYFSRGGDGRFRMHFLVPRIRDVEVVVTRNVKEALLLENQLIKKHRPRFNVRLRDDKNYLGLRIDARERFPRFSETRRFGTDGASYFGPYTSSKSMRKTLGALQKVFPLRTCSDTVFKSYQRKGRPCLEHAVGRCAGPCCDLIDETAYGELVTGAIRLLKGQSVDLRRELEERMQELASQERFEDAARLRDRLVAIERTVEKQSMISVRFVDRDVFAIAREGRRLEIQSLHVRQGVLLGGNSYSFRDVRIDDAAVLESFLAQFYDADRDFPGEVLVPIELEGARLLESLWRDRRGRVVRLHVPRRGERRRLIEMAERNAKLALTERSRREGDSEVALRELAGLLGLAGPPQHIECYDTSHLQGTLHVASRVSFRDGQPDPDAYRRYRMREAEPGDDYGAMREVLQRRLARLDTDPAPDLILLDGGKGQLNAVRALLADLGIEGIALASLAKERDDESPSPRVKRHGGTKREKLFLPGVKDPLLPQPDAPAFLVLQRIRDESHRFAIRYHRELRRKFGLRSILDELPGIGPVKRRSLLRTLGSLERVKRASEEELAAVPHVSAADAAVVARFFRAAADDAVKSDAETADSGTDGD
ncbi:MAG: excinuclease ABC subunit UvrC [Deltaproteobacteria bacterium]|nr:excinuclease ABC subunit UvrC [Deltaproteobacteria bacterium]MBW2414023.1 excinuclease ABC subunit UvrC [Deltaproteobacteria bacterium]